MVLKNFEVPPGWKFTPVVSRLGDRAGLENQNSGGAYKNLTEFLIRFLLWNLIHNTKCHIHPELGFLREIAEQSLP